MRTPAPTIWDHGDMEAEELAATDAGGVLLGASRTRALEVLQDAGRPLGVTEVGELLGLHINTARFHLDGLVAAGLATRSQEGRSSPGRPRTVYEATAVRQVGQRSYRLLAQILASSFAAVVPDAAAAALAAGRAWGQYLTEEPAPFQDMEPADAVAQLVELLDEIGFDPQVAGATGHPSIRLRHCPFREVATEHHEVVCAVHLGLMQGALSEMKAPLAAERLEPFVEPSLCLAQLSPAPVAAGAQAVSPTQRRRPTRTSAS